MAKRVLSVLRRDTGVAVVQAVVEGHGWRARVQRAAMLAAILAGVSPAGGNYPVATVAITGDGAGDQTVESPVVKILDGWMEIRSDPSGG